MTKSIAASTPSARRTIFMATLGVMPQVVTLALDELLRRGFAFHEAIILHTVALAPPMKPSLDRLKGEVACYPHIPFRFVRFEDKTGHRPTDIATEADARAVQGTLWRELRKAKARGDAVHLSIAGGRKVISSYGTSVAQMIFDEGDCCWHLMSEVALQDRGAMHAGPQEQVVLVPVPITLWSSLPPAATALALTDDPFEAQQWQRHRLHNERRWQLRAFLGQLSEVERQTLLLMAGRGLDAHDLARALGYSKKTIDNHLTSIRSEYSQFMREHDDRRRLNNGVLVADFGALADEEKAAEQTESRPT